MDLYLAGMEESCVGKIDWNALFSYIGQGKLQFDNLKDFIKPGKLFIDSGAFSAWTKGAKVNVKEYIRWLNERTEHRDNRILFNALYMQKKVKELNNKERKFTFRKKLF